MTKPTMYTEDELRQTLKDRQGGYTLAQYAAEIGLSIAYLSQILTGSRPVSNEKVLDFLAPTGMTYIKRDVYMLVKK